MRVRALQELGVLGGLLSTNIASQRYFSGARVGEAEIVRAGHLPAVKPSSPAPFRCDLRALTAPWKQHMNCLIATPNSAVIAGMPGTAPPSSALCVLAGPLLTRQQRVGGTLDRGYSPDRGQPW
jgi:hypothetical protein